MEAPDRKRLRPDFINGHGNFSTESLNPSANGSGGSSGLQGKSKPCLKFFSTSGCPYGEGCHFSHYVPGGLSAISSTTSGFGIPSTIKPAGGLGSSFGAQSSLPSVSGANLGGFKTRLCNQFGTAEGCRFGDKCHFAHGERELRKSNASDTLTLTMDTSRILPNASFSPFTGEPKGTYSWHQNFPSSNVHASVGLQREPSPPGIAGSFGVSSMAKISIDATMAGVIIGKGGMHAKEISRLTGAKLAIREHEIDPNLRNVELEGTFDQIKMANQMVRDILMHKDPLPPKAAVSNPQNYKTKLCQNYSQGTCTFGDRCHFAHGEAELRKPSLSV